MSAHRVLKDLFRAYESYGAGIGVDPGDAGTMTVDKQGLFFPIVTAGVETRILAAPSRPGILSAVCLSEDGGTMTLTVTGGYNNDDDTSITFDDVGDVAVFYSIQEGTSYYWRLIAQEGTNAAVEAGVFDTVTAGAIVGGDNSLGITGQTQAATVNGGAVAIAGAASIAGATGDGGAVTVAGGASGSTNGAGGAVSATGGLGTGTGAGGAVTITGGVAGATGTGGAVSVTGGASAAGATGAGGALALAGGDSGSTNGAGGAATFEGGAGTGTGAGGAVSVTGGASGAGATGNGGAVVSAGGAAASTDGAGGLISMTGGAGAGTGNGGAASLVGGAGGTTGAGGAVTITSGASAGAGGTAGAIAIDTGAAAGGTGAGILIGNTNAVGVTITAPLNYAAGGGAADVQTLTLNPAPTRYTTGMMIAWRPTADNTGACTMNVNGLGAKSIKTQSGADPAAGDLDSGTGIQMAIYDGTNFVLINPATSTD